VLLVILIVQNTGHVRVGWIFGHSRVSLVFLILFASILGWIAGIATSIVSAVAHAARRAAEGTR